MFHTDYVYSFLHNTSWLNKCFTQNISCSFMQYDVSDCLNDCRQVSLVKRFNPVQGECIEQRE